MHFVKMKDNMRVMTFGCSFTKYHWPTWADIVLKQAELEGLETDNWGMPGTGNLFIAIQIQHAIAKGLLKAGDHAFIAWSTMSREDRLVDGRWLTPGNIFNQNLYPQSWVEKYADMEFYALRDCALINSTRAALDGLGIKQTQFSMAQQEPYRSSHPATKKIMDKVNEITDIYKCKFECTPILEVIPYPPPVSLQVNWSVNDPTDVYTDTHHHPVSMLKYVKQELCSLGIPWLTAIDPRVETWTHEWDHKIKTAPQPLRYAEFPIVLSKNPQWGF
jgi:hypothetical protein